MPITKATTNVIDLNKDTLINGITAGRGKSNNGSSTAFGVSALSSITAGVSNTAIGNSALSSHVNTSNNTGVGNSSLQSLTSGGSNTALGSGSMQYITTSNGSVSIGVVSLQQAQSSNYTIAIGNTAAAGLGVNPLIASNYNICIGDASMAGAEGTVEENVFIGSGSGFFNKGDYNVGVGNSSLRNVSATGTNNTAIGFSSGYNCTGLYNSAIGSYALNSSNGNNNVALGFHALRYPTESTSNTALGTYSLQTIPVGTTNSTGVGYNSQITGSNQVQLGNSSTTTYAYGAVQDRSDIRDKADVRDTELGLEFIKALRPVDFKWDLREDYRTEPPKPVDEPVKIDENASDEEKAKYAEELAVYNTYKIDFDKWFEDVKLANITHDASKKRSRFHHGLIAQEVKAVLDEKGIDFGGYQDHSIKGGDDVLSVGYSELIAPMIKAIQELSAEVVSLKAQLNT